MGTTEIIIIVVVLILLFGAKKLPDMARGLGRSMRIFKSEITEMQNDGKDKPAEKAAEAPAPRELPASEQVIDGTAESIDHKKSA